MLFRDPVEIFQSGVLISRWGSKELYQERKSYAERRAMYSEFVTVLLNKLQKTANLVKT
jgi:hypothetical protein